MRQGASFAILAGLFLAAGRYFSPDASSAQVTSAPAHSAVSRGQLSTSKGRGNDKKWTSSCSAFEPAKSAAPTDKENPDRGAALEVFHRFLNPSNPPPKDYATQTITYAIALAPDPRHTHLALYFDRTVEAIEEAAQQEGYLFNSSWLPWQTESASYPRLQDELRSEQWVEERENCPGLLLFRKLRDETSTDDAYEHGLAVLLVGEQPTGGVNAKEWQTATKWIRDQMRANGRPSDLAPLRVLGPTFSGSLPSLSRLLGQLPKPPNRPNPTNQPMPVVIAAGGLGSAYSVGRFRRQNKETPFFLFEENDPLQECYLNRHLGDDTTLAILSEDETAYGAATIPADPARAAPGPADPAPCAPGPAAPAPAACRPTRSLQLFYPRDISALRSAYEEQSIFAAGESQTSRAIHLALRPNLREEQLKEGDTVPQFDRQREALAQEAKLYGVVSQLNAHHSRYVLLRCTNPLDYLFLASFLHYRYPEGRIISSTSDMLFRRAVDTSEYRGMLALSNYPLFPEQSHMAGAGNADGSHSHPIFPSDNSEAMFNAALFLFQTDVPKHCFENQTGSLPVSCFSGKTLRDYRAPRWGPKLNHAPVWLSILGRDGYWPVAILDLGEKHRACGADTEKKDELCSSITGVDVVEEKLNMARRHDDAPISWKLVTLGCLLFGAFHCWNLHRQNRYAGDGSNDFRQKNLGRTHSYCAGLVCSICLSLSAAMLLPYACSFWRGRALYIDFSPFATISLLLFIVLVGLSLRTLFVGYGKRALLTSVVCLVIVLIALTLFLIRHDQAKFFIYRALHVVSGVSPLLPMIFFALAFCFFGLQMLKCCTLLDPGKPELPHPGILPSELHPLSSEKATRIEQVASLASRNAVVWLPGMIFVVASPLLYEFHLPIRSVEGPVYDWTISIFVLAAVVCILHTSTRLFLTWNCLKGLLLTLDRTPLRRTLAALDAISLDSLWKISGHSCRVQYSFLARQVDSLRRLLLHPPELVNHSRLAQREAMETAQKFLDDNARRPMDSVNWAGPSSGQEGLRRKLATACGDAVNDVLTPHWKQALESLNLTAKNKASDAADPSKGLASLLDEDSGIRAAEEFVSYFYIAYIQNILAAMRTMVLGIICLFVGTSAALAFYPFSPRTAIGLLLFAIFALVAAVVGIVYAGMERDETLSLITDTKPQVGIDFFLKFGTFAIGPLLGLLTTQFPQVAEAVLGWLQPGLQAVR